MDVLIDPHTLVRAEERGTNADEIKDVIETGLMVRPSTFGLVKQKCTSSNKAAWIDIMSKKGLKCFT
jgi:hypothetical protein